MTDGAREDSDRAGLGDGALLVGLLVFSALLRLALLGVNGGEYTDGILQITQFERTDSFWPPLYTALVWVLRAMGVEALPAGRLISWAASVALVLPLWWVARAWGGRRAALFTGVLYTVSPLAMRWSLRVMTDMLFVCLFHAACAGLLVLWSRRGTTGGPETRGGSGRKDIGPARAFLLSGPQARRGKTVVWITILAVLATLTRYQGLMLAPLVALALAGLWRGRTAASGGRGGAVAVQLAWLALPAWLLYQQFGHVQQVAGRAPPGGVWAMLVTYWGRFEMFLYVVPYVLTLPVFVFFMVGLIGGPFRRNEPESGPTVMPVRLLLLYVALAVLVAQSVFLSFQTRYLLPILPLALTCAGMGMARAERRLARLGRAGRKGLAVLTAVTVLWSLGFAMASVALQRGAFADIYAAGRHIRDLQDLSPTARVYTNESYGGKEGMDGINLSFVSGRQAEAIPEAAYWFKGRPCPPDLPAMEPGSILAVHSRNCFGAEPYLAFIGFLDSRYELIPLEYGTFDAWLVPLLPDIMGEAGSEQNPLAWAVLRYQKQTFLTCLFLVGQRRPSPP